MDLRDFYEKDKKVLRVGVHSKIRTLHMIFYSFISLAAAASPAEKGDA